MKFNPETHKRNTIRLKEYDYSQAGFYFVTICTKDRENIFGAIENNEMLSNEFGIVINQIINELSTRFKNIIIDKCVIMPNHVHLILQIIDDDNKHHNVGVELALPNNANNFNKTIKEKYKGRASSAPTIPKIVQAFKSISTIEINRIKNLSGLLVWQRNYYEHILRNENELFETRKYIEQNPLKWSLDENNVM